ncbi:hypothetical protein LR48_Vigan07g253600 [Vigna angularis]|uniref:Uncharacterized protein n=1 Tax=Phaseolus angularis TaxID=3914 RepID=A0A0L9V1T4_PHAAN|nr:hypothetical protein LR48_Vigan07g253600 [Vigna angularis]
MAASVASTSSASASPLESEGPTSTPKDPSSIPIVSEAIASFRNSLNLDSPPSSKFDASSRKHVWGSVVRNLTQLYHISQLPEREMSLLLRATSSPRPVVGAAIAHVGGSHAVYNVSASTFATLTPGESCSHCDQTEMLLERHSLFFLKQSPPKP